MKNLSPFKQYFFLCFFLVFSGVVSAQEISNVHLEYSCPCKVTVTYDLFLDGDVVLYYSPDTVGTGWLLAETFSDKAAGTNIVDVWDCEAAGAVYGVFYYKLEWKEPPCKKFDDVVINGVRWATCNVDAPGTFVECPEDFGLYYQWGRKGDGHEQLTSPNYPTNNNVEENGTVTSGFDANGQIGTGHAAYGKFIKSRYQYYSYYPWRVPVIPTLWNSGTVSAPVKTANDPSPTGYRVPTEAEIQSLIDENYVTIQWILGPIPGMRFTDKNNGNSIFLPAAGFRNAGGGDIGSNYGVYWSSTAYSANPNYFVSLQIYNLLPPYRIQYSITGNGFPIRPVVE